MSRWFTMIAGTTAVVTSLACSGMGGGFANQAACKGWVETQNALPCYKIAQMDVDQSCPASLDLAAVDMVAYYECMENGVECNGDIPNPKGQMDCAALQKF